MGETATDPTARAVELADAALVGDRRALARLLKVHHVLGTLIDYLERALPALRRADWTIGDELALVGLYLELIEQRFAGLRKEVLAAFERIPVYALNDEAAMKAVSAVYRGGLDALKAKLEKPAS